MNPYDDAHKPDPSVRPNQRLTEVPLGGFQRVWPEPTRWQEFLSDMRTLGRDLRRFFRL